VVITCGRKPLAKLVPYEVAAERPRVGDMLDEPFAVSEEALRPMSKAELGEWGLS
jgi:hypothetical protein